MVLGIQVDHEVGKVIYANLLAGVDLSYSIRLIYSRVEGGLSD